MTVDSAFRQDLQRFYDSELGRSGNRSAASKIVLFICHFGLHCVAVYRLGQFARRRYRRNRLLGLPVMMIYKVLNWIMKVVHHVNLENADIAPGLYICHVGTIYIGPSVIGKNLSITHNVTIGVGHSIKTRGIPRIGDNVWIGTGSVISGSIKVGNQVTIGSGSMLSRDVPDGCFVCGNPGRVVISQYDNAHLSGNGNQIITGTAA